MSWRVLGPVEVVAGGRLLDIRRPQQRAVLAYLLLNRGQVVPTEQLVAALWADTAPVGARKQVGVRVSEIRRTLRSAGVGEVLVSTAGGYQLTVAVEELDAARVAANLSRARAAKLVGHPAEVVGEVRDALSLWRGPPLAGATAAFVEAAAVRLQEQRLAAYEELADAELDLGRYESVVELLGPVVDAHPLRERLVARLMLALAGSGQQAGALELFTATRVRLVDELGVEPTPELSAVYRRVLRHQVPVSFIDELLPARPPWRSAGGS